MKKSELIEELSKLEARSMWEMLPAFRFKDGKNYTEMDLTRAYYNGLREMEEAWHKVITELKKKIKSEDKPK